MLLDPKNDFVFKRLFANAPALLADLINAVRSNQPPVQALEVLNPRIDPTELTGKFVVLDVLARDAAGLLYDIEMQMRSHPHWYERSVYYLARTHAHQLRGGQEYGALRPSSGVHLMNFELFDDPGQGHWCLKLRDGNQPAAAFRATLQLDLIELPKLGRLRPGNAALAAWVAYFEHWQEDTIMSTITHEPVQQARQQLAQLSADEEAQRLAFVRERAMRDEASFMKAAREEGWREGIEKGREEGREEGLKAGRLETRRQFARRLIEQAGLDDAAIARLTDLSEDEVRQVRQR